MLSSISSVKVTNSYFDSNLDISPANSATFIASSPLEESLTVNAPMSPKVQPLISSLDSSQLYMDSIDDLYIEDIPCRVTQEPSLSNTGSPHAHTYYQRAASLSIINSTGGFPPPTRTRSLSMPHLKGDSRTNIMPKPAWCSSAGFLGGERTFGRNPEPLPLQSGPRDGPFFPNMLQNPAYFSPGNLFASNCNLPREMDPLLGIRNGEGRASASWQCYHIPSSKPKHVLKVKSHVCHFCFRSFTRKHDLHRHIRVHTGDKPYRCNYCSKSFARTDALKRHHRVDEQCQSAHREAQNSYQD
ncbi:hypothetical protein K7432_014504 [Basidiobolus ranarum]|uniref:C2H2-type domain-containing protein n=1 Tax=Basidiobolus ranarum TaxID=34480 RepID=A0ABR2VPF7_9FUNG